MTERRLLETVIEDGNYDLAADEALDSKWAIQVGPRAERIAEMIRGAS